MEVEHYYVHIEDCLYELCYFTDYDFSTVFQRLYTQSKCCIVLLCVTILFYSVFGPK